ncbi:hypothetical protein DOTSEDRAFT_68668 [Dothistroma septosporum NZE10]|uniref:Uncharacterized protein n=1 Tax=Dothistroma septosporum (strain NZE10 / CBS 128990) TaxID=675120 RepID=N1Q4V4_DOTSN|nr:hypothetical protein DOTSEDRAFT_68668 [Dothistroma septosporum NZE10]
MSISLTSQARTSTSTSILSTEYAVPSSATARPRPDLGVYDFCSKSNHHTHEPLVHAPRRTCNHIVRDAICRNNRD